jgi:nucleoside-diphosphate-sugar epimerase
MSDGKNIFLTGVTGFLGSHLTDRLLKEGHRITALARGSKNTSAKTRVAEVMAQVGSVDTERLTVYEGDITHARLGLSEEDFARIAASTDEVWHCAASLSFSEDDRDEIFQMNVGGTQNLLELVEQTASRRLQHVSTAYIAGNRKDPALETDINVGQTFKNPYEESKCQSELLVDAAHRSGAISASVYRPSIVIGDSRSGRVTHFHGVYAFMRGLWAALERLRRRLPDGQIVQLPLRLLGAENTTLNFVPIDYVVEGMIEISSKPSSVGGTYHLANPLATENRVWLPNICRVMGVEGIQLVGSESFSKSPMTRLETVFQKQMAFYYQYLQGEPKFDCSRALEALKGTGIECPRVTVEFIEKITGWYVNFLNTGRQEA